MKENIFKLQIIATYTTVLYDQWLSVSYHNTLYESWLTSTFFCLYTSLYLWPLFSKAVLQVVYYRFTWECFLPTQSLKCSKCQSPNIANAVNNFKNNSSCCVNYNTFITCPSMHLLPSSGTELFNVLHKVGVGTLYQEHNNVFSCICLRFVIMEKISAVRVTHPPCMAMFKTCFFLCSCSHSAVWISQ